MEALRGLPQRFLQNAQVQQLLALNGEAPPDIPMPQLAPEIPMPQLAPVAPPLVQPAGYAAEQPTAGDHPMPAADAAPGDLEGGPPEGGRQLGRCVVCMDADADATFVHEDTGHTVCCLQCANHVARTRRRCPMCNRPIRSVIRNFFN